MYIHRKIPTYLYRYYISLYFYLYLSMTPNGDSEIDNSVSGCLNKGKR